jgi:hypothetical protein
MNGNPDSIQYTPVVNGNLEWQIFSGEGFDLAGPLQLRALDARAGRHLCRFRPHLDRRRAGARHAASQEPVPLGIDRLHRGRAPISPISASLRSPITGIPIRRRRRRPAGRLGRVLAGLPGHGRGGRAGAGGPARLVGHQVAAHPVESNGIDNLSLAGADAEGHSYHRALHAAQPLGPEATMHFGFSDKVRVFLNGRPSTKARTSRVARLSLPRHRRLLGHALPAARGGGERGRLRRHRRYQWRHGGGGAVRAPDPALIASNRRRRLARRLEKAEAKRQGERHLSQRALRPTGSSPCSAAAAFSAATSPRRCSAPAPASASPSATRAAPGS